MEGPGFDPCLNCRLVISGGDLDISTVEATTLPSTIKSFITDFVKLFPPVWPQIHEQRMPLLSKVKLGHTYCMQH